MTFDPDLSNDCLLVDGTETVTLHSTSTVAVEGAKRGQLTLEEIEFRQVGLESADLGWNLPEANLAGLVPRQGDAIEDAGGTFWTVLSARHSPLSGVWRVVTRRQV
ncbi:MAG: hypothetical protein DWQ37_01900 [Planctomycetota bacterium]|nr:MAG: hypothetical protein DWQ37_01900 [Planctomycetota bacterium]